MCTAVALVTSELPLTLVERHLLQDRVHERGGESEVRFYARAVPAVLPVWWNGRLHVAKWGNRDRAERKLPPTAWTWKETVAEGKWAALETEEVLVPASFGYMNGVWYKVKEGMRAVLVQDRAGRPVVYLICETATRYYEVMTRAEWMPCLVGEVI